MSVSVKGTVLSSSPCTLKESSKFLERFLNSDVLPEEGLLRGYLTSVASAIEEGVTRDNLNKQRKQDYDQKFYVNQGSKESDLKVGKAKSEPVVNGGKDFHSSHSKRRDRDVDGNEHDSGSSKRPKKKLKTKH